MRKAISVSGCSTDSAAGCGLRGGGPAPACRDAGRGGPQVPSRLVTDRRGGGRGTGGRGAPRPSSDEAGSEAITVPQKTFGVLLKTVLITEVVPSLRSAEQSFH